MEYICIGTQSMGDTFMEWNFKYDTAVWYENGRNSRREDTGR